MLQRVLGERQAPPDSHSEEEHTEHLSAQLGRDLGSTRGHFSIRQSSSEHVQHEISCTRKLPQVSLGISPSSLTHQVHLALIPGCSPRSDIPCHKAPLSRTFIQMGWQRPVNPPKKPQTKHICSEARSSESPQPELMPRGECHQALGASCPQPTVTAPGKVSVTQCPFILVPLPSGEDSVAAHCHMLLFAVFSWSLGFCLPLS